jgi:hypothetical protein
VTGAVAGMLARTRRPPVTGLLPDAMPATTMPAGPAPAEPKLAEAGPAVPLPPRRAAPGRAPARHVPVAAPVELGRPRIEPRTPAPLPDSDRVTEPAPLAIAPRAVTRRPDRSPDPATGQAGSRSTPPASRPAAARSISPSESSDPPVIRPAHRVERAAVPTDPAGPDGGPRLPRDRVDGPTQPVSPAKPDSAPATAPVRAEPVPPVVIESIRVEVAGPARPAPDPFAGLRHHLGGITRWGRR